MVLVLVLVLDRRAFESSTSTGMRLSTSTSTKKTLKSWDSKLDALFRRTAHGAIPKNDFHSYARRRLKPEHQRWCPAFRRSEHARARSQKKELFVKLTTSKLTGCIAKLSAIK
jgi:hypothetical protein